MKQPLRYFLSTLTAAFLLGTSAPQARAQTVPGPEVPTTLVVSVAQPNPFTSTARFTVAVRRDQHVRVELHNLLGQRVQTLFDGRLEAGEGRTVTMESAGLPAGLYLYRVQGDRSVVTRQVVLSR